MESNEAHGTGEPVSGGSATQTSTPRADSVSSGVDRHPAAIGPYKILELLGEGGMGVVYLAEQTQPIRRRVALKVVKLGMDTKEIIARFESERQALALMNHPNVAAVYDAGATEHGRPYFVMEHVPGEPITRYCDKHRLSLRERLGLFTHVCEAIQHAHQKGIIHRDIKPSNVLVAIQDGKPVPKVIDFGVAKATNQRLTERTVFTEQGKLIGTPEYMSPEQAEMSALDVDTRTDIYSLGVLLYELLSGALPFDAGTLRRAGYAEMQRIIREVEPPKPSTRLSKLGADVSRVAAPPVQGPVSPTAPTVVRDLAGWSAAAAPCALSVARSRQTDPKSLIRKLRGDLDWVVMKALDKDRTRRYASASEFAADIAHHLNDEPVKARPPSAVYRARKFVRKHWQAVAATSAFMLLLIAGLLVTYTQRNRARAAEQQALRKTEQARTAEAAERQARGNEQVQKIRLLVQRGHWVRVLEEIENSLGAHFGDEHELRLLRIRAYDALSMTDRARAEIESLYPAEPPPEWRPAVLLWLGEYYLDGAETHDEGIRDLQEVVRSAQSPADRVYAEALLTDSLTVAIEKLEAAVRLDAFRLRPWQMLGVLKVFSGQLAGAIGAFSTARVIFPEDPSLKVGLALAHAFAGNHEAARETLQSLAGLTPATKEVVAGALELVSDVFNEVASNLDADDLKSKRASFVVRLLGLFGQYQALGPASTEGLDPQLNAAFSRSLPLLQSSWGRVLPAIAVLLRNGSPDAAMLENLRRAAEANPEGCTLWVYAKALQQAGDLGTAYAVAMKSVEAPFMVNARPRAMQLAVSIAGALSPEQRAEIPQRERARLTEMIRELSVSSRCPTSVLVELAANSAWLDPLLARFLLERARVPRPDSEDPPAK